VLFQNQTSHSKTPNGPSSQFFGIFSAVARRDLNPRFFCAIRWNILGEPLGKPMGPSRPGPTRFYKITEVQRQLLFAYLLRGRLNIRFRGLKKDVELAAELNLHLDLEV
jgi:hypothetical protein